MSVDLKMRRCTIKFKKKQTLKDFEIFIGVQSDRPTFTILLISLSLMSINGKHRIYTGFVTTTFRGNTYVCTYYSLILAIGSHLW